MHHPVIKRSQASPHCEGANLRKDSQHEEGRHFSPSQTRMSVLPPALQRWSRLPAPRGTQVSNVLTCKLRGGDFCIQVRGPLHPPACGFMSQPLIRVCPGTLSHRHSRKEHLCSSHNAVLSTGRLFRTLIYGHIRVYCSLSRTC